MMSVMRRAHLVIWPTVVALRWSIVREITMMSWRGWHFTVWAGWRWWRRHIAVLGRYAVWWQRGCFT